MLIKAANEHGLDLTRCTVIGDVGSTDMLAAAAVGAVKVLVMTGWGNASMDTHRYKWYDQAPRQIFRCCEMAYKRKTITCLI